MLSIYAAPKKENVVASSEDFRRQAHQLCVGHSHGKGSALLIGVGGILKQRSKLICVYNFYSESLRDSDLGLARCSTASSKS